MFYIILITENKIYRLILVWLNQHQKESDANIFHIT